MLYEVVYDDDVTITYYYVSAASVQDASRQVGDHIMANGDMWFPARCIAVNTWSNVALYKQEESV